MIRRTLLCSFLFVSMTACTGVAVRSGPVVSVMPVEDTGPWSGESVSPVPSASAPAPKIADGIGESYTIIKAGTFIPEGDISDLDEGFSGEVIFGRSLMHFLAIEGSVGYIDIDGSYGATQLELMVIPLMVNLRASLPVLFFEPYLGLGAGGVYADYSAGGFSDSDFVGAMNAFIGIEFGLGRTAIGAEYKYLQTSDTDDGFAIEGGTASLFVSIPF